MKTLNIKKTYLATILASTLVISPATLAEQNDLAAEKTELLTKEEQKENENIGFGAGAIIGGIVAGPLGVVVTSIFGVFAAEHYNAVEQEDRLTAKLSEEKNSYQVALNNYQQKLDEAEQAYQQELLALQHSQDKTSQLQAENLLMSLQFSTGSSEIKPHYQEQIRSLAKMLDISPKLTIDLSGYTDLQGSNELNHALSLARVNSVKKALINQGVQPERINLYAFGEQAPVVANQEKQASFYDRRVVIKLQNDIDNSKPINQTVSNH